MIEKPFTTYAFQKDGVTYKIQSILDGEEPKPTSPGVLLVREKEFLNNLKGGDDIEFSLMLKPKDEFLNNLQKYNLY